MANPTIVEPLVEGYIQLGLRLGRHDEGIVDAYYGPAALAARVADEPVRSARELLVDVRRLIADLDGPSDHGITGARARWLGAQLRGLEMVCRVLSGETVPYLEEVEACYGVRPEPVDDDEIHAAQLDLDRALRGGGRLDERLASMRERHTIPIERLATVIRTLADELGARTRSLFGLPEGESVDFELVRDKPWSGFNHYLGGLRSKVVVNTDLPVLSTSIAHLVAHEAYPGHHTEHTRKELGLVQRRQQWEESIALVGTPSCLMAEGLADLGLEALVGPAPHLAVEPMIRAAGLTYEVDAVDALAGFSDVSGRARGRLAVELHANGRDPDEVVSLAERWLLLDHARATKAVEFLTDRTWRAYVFCYAEGHRRCQAFMAGDPTRFTRLLDEQLVPADLVPPSFEGA